MILSYVYAKMCVFALDLGEAFMFAFLIDCF